MKLWTGKCTAVLVLAICSSGPAMGVPLWETLAQGIQLFSQFINLNPDSPISPIFQFVSHRLLLNHSPQKGDAGERDETNQGNKDDGPWGTLFRTLGLTPKQMSAFSVDLLIFLAQMVNNAFSSHKEGKRRGKFIQKPLIETIIEQPRISRMLSTMQDPKLMDHVLQEVDGRLVDTDSDCPQQLLCRLSPIVKGMQTSLAFFLRDKVFPKENTQRGDSGEQENKSTETESLAAMWRKLTPMERLVFFMPSFQDFMKEGEPCRKRYTRCGSN